MTEYEAQMMRNTVWWFVWWVTGCADCCERACNGQGWGLSSCWAQHRPHTGPIRVMS